MRKKNTGGPYGQQLTGKWEIPTKVAKANHRVRENP